MARHQSSAALLPYLHGTIHQLIGPIEEVSWAFWKEGDETPDGLNSLYLELQFIGLHFSTLEADVKEDIAALLNDVDRELCPQYVDYPELSNE